MKPKIAVLGAILLSIKAPEALATVHVVPDQFPTIQSAIDFASSGDTVLILPGTYVGSLVLAGKDLTLLGEAGPALTTLTTNDLARILDIGAGVTSATLLTGLHFSKGRADSGGAIRVTRGAAPTIRRCWFTENFAYQPAVMSNGGALSLSNGSALIEDCEFRMNYALIYYEGHLAHGGAVGASASSLVIRRSQFQENHAYGYQRYGFGAALYLFQTPAVIESCSFIGNRGDDGAIRSIEAPLTIRDCLFRENSSFYGSTVIWAGRECDNCTVHISESVFFDNLGSLAGGVIDVEGRGIVTHNTIAYNPCHGIIVREVGEDLLIDHNIVSNNQFGIACTAAEPVVEIKCNDIWGNEWGDYGCSSGVPGSNGNISSDPLFCNGPARDLRLHTNSPCAPDQNACGLVGALPVGCDVLRVPPPTASLENITLAPIRPNPSSVPIQLTFEIAQQAELRLEIFDAAGRRCAVLVDRFFEAGRHVLIWSGKDARGRAIRSGVYLAVLQGADRRRTQRFVVIH